MMLEWAINHKIGGVNGMIYSHFNILDYENKNYLLNLKKATLRNFTFSALYPEYIQAGVNKKLKRLKIK